MAKKIAVFDSNSQKFTGPMIEYWRKQGHEVNYEYGYNPWLANEADVTFIDVCDNNAVVATTGGGVGGAGDEWIFKGKKLVVRAIDIELWSGFHHNVNWDRVNDVVFVADHMKQWVERDIDFPAHHVGVHHIPCGVQTDTFTMRRASERNKRVAFVCEFWGAKGIDLMLEIAYLLKPHGYVIQCLGKWAISEPWYMEWINYYIRDNNLDVSFDEWADNMNDWLENKAFALTCSKKETFSYAIAEGMSKGMKPIIHNFQGAKDIWPSQFVFNTAQEAVDLILSEEFNPWDYRNFIKDNYGFELMMERMNQVMGLDS